MPQPNDIRPGYERFVVGRMWRRPRKPRPRNKKRELLNDRQKLSVAALVRWASASQAAREAGYSDVAAAQVAYKLFKNVHIRKAVDESLDRVLDLPELDRA